MQVIFCKSKSSLKSFVASPSQVSSHLLQVQFKSQVFWPKSKSSQVPSQLATAQVPSHFEKFCYYLIDAYAILSSLDNLVNIKKKCDYFSTINCIWYHFHDTLFVEYSIWCYIFKCGLICFELIPSTFELSEGELCWGRVVPNPFVYERSCHAERVINKTVPAAARAQPTTCS